MYAHEALKNCYGIATLDDLKPGVKLWHVYGCRGSEAVEFTVMTGVVSCPVLDAHINFHLREYREYHFEPKWVIGFDVNGRLRYHSINDCGIGANYNNHRLFTSFKAAKNYINLLNS